MIEILIYFLIGSAGGVAQYIMDDTELWKVVVLAVFWPFFLAVLVWLAFLRAV